MTYAFTTMPSPVGELRLVASDAGLSAIMWTTIPNAVSAVVAANAKNPTSIIGPCHRVVGASGKLTGYAGGLEAKALLLNLERKNDPARARYVE